MSFDCVPPPNDRQPNSSSPLLPDLGCKEEKLTPLMVEDPDTELDRISEDSRSLQREARLQKYQVESVSIH
ncbi:hypothetical protein ARMSODRAFT_1027496 [Armillaria solidipes]|uniref:Uncharacterized protein n=1 Tax=Armillaria solidipes TaxID=1076256 RepID=A0A2H3ARK5_9AGAR|nr:hypothetical protein ARMSODRAFT_1027496 [Armillaria solidipes]